MRLIGVPPWPHNRGVYAAIMLQDENGDPVEVLLAYLADIASYRLLRRAGAGRVFLPSIPEAGEHVKTIPWSRVVRMLLDHVETGAWRPLSKADKAAVAALQQEVEKRERW